MFVEWFIVFSRESSTQAVAAAQRSAGWALFAVVASCGSQSPQRCIASIHAAALSLDASARSHTCGQPLCSACSAAARSQLCSDWRRQRVHHEGSFVSVSSSITGVIINDDFYIEFKFDSDIIIFIVIYIPFSNAAA